MLVLPGVYVLTNDIIVYSWCVHRNTNTIETMYRIKLQNVCSIMHHNFIKRSPLEVKTVQYLIEIKHQPNIHNINIKFGPVYSSFATKYGRRPWLILSLVWHGSAMGNEVQWSYDICQIPVKSAWKNIWDYYDYQSAGNRANRPIQ